MGFRLSAWDQKLLRYAELFETRMMDLNVNLDIAKQLDLGWTLLAECFQPSEVGLKKAWIEKYGKWQGTAAHG